MRVEWSNRALSDMEELRAYIAQDSAARADDVFLKIATAVGRLEKYPLSGRPGRVAGTRELVVSKTPYIVPYCIRNGAPEIIAVVHGSRQWPDEF
jgi:toxin ParE1/3/4